MPGASKTWKKFKIKTTCNHATVCGLCSYKTYLCDICTMTLTSLHLSIFLSDNAVHYLDYLFDSQIWSPVLKKDPYFFISAVKCEMHCILKH